MQTLSENKSLNLLSRLLIAPAKNIAVGTVAPELEKAVLQISKADFDALVALADTNHVIVRGLEVFRSITAEAGDEQRTSWADEALSAERARIDNAVAHLWQITNAFTNRRYSVAVIKSLDHLPDLGSDLDLFTNASPGEVIQLMREEFRAVPDARSWGDRLAGKWNFIVPGLPELVEIHVQRLGQTGEQFAIASSLIDRTRCITVGELMFRVPAVSDRLMISTLQRMYRHFYFRLCDVIDSAQLVESGMVDYDDLYVAAKTAGIWEGMATYLAIVSDYVKRFRGEGLDIPQWVLKAARFDGREIYFAKDFLRVPILPQSAMLYGKQLAGTFRRRQIHSGARLSLLPWLATAALVGQKITGSDKGIW
jgi:hypothetical protein